MIDSGSPVTLIPKSPFNRITPLKPIGTEDRDVNNNRIKFEGKTIASLETNGKQNKPLSFSYNKENQPLTSFSLDGETGNNAGHRQD